MFCSTEGFHWDLSSSHWPGSPGSLRELQISQCKVMRVQPIDLMLSSSSSGNASIAQFSMDVREVLQVRELPQKQMIAFLFFLLLENASCHFYASFKVPSPQHCFASVGCHGMGIRCHFSPSSLGASAWGLTFVASFTSAHRCPLRGLVSGAQDCRLWALHQHAPWSFYCDEDVLWHLELEILLLYSELSSWKREEYNTEGVFAR